MEKKMKKLNKPNKLNKPKEPNKPIIGEEVATKKKGKTRFIFGRDMSLEEMVDAVVRMAKEYGIEIVDDRKEHGIPIVDSRKKESQKDRGEGKPRKSPP
jgi:hypothetical protein